MLTDKTTKALLSSFAISLWNTIISDEYFSTESTSRLLDSLITYLTLRQETLHKIKVYSYFAIFCLVLLGIFKVNFHKFPYLTWEIVHPVKCKPHNVWGLGGF